MDMRRAAPAVLLVFPVPARKSGIGQVFKQRPDLRFAKTSHANVHSARIRDPAKRDVRVMDVPPAR